MRAVFSTLFFFFKFAAESAYAQDLKAQKEAAYADALRSIKMEESARARAESAEKAARRANEQALPFFFFDFERRRK